MKEEKKRRDPQVDFLGEISRQLAGKGPEQDFLESISPEIPSRDVPINVGERARSVREKRGLSLQDISQRTDIDRSLLAQVEGGVFTPPLGMVIKLAKPLR